MASTSSESAAAPS
uniref:Uncharacterized protein n=1 Tax=Steinernema glaseri TaxID=37863 RepID=A0A1I7YDI1_9BILA